MSEQIGYLDTDALSPEDLAFAQAVEAQIAQAAATYHLIPSDVRWVDLRLHQERRRDEITAQFWRQREQLAAKAARKGRR